MLLLLLSLLLFYVHLVILNKVDLILIKTIISIRCPDDKISFIGFLHTINKIDNLRSYCSHPYLVSSDDLINIFTINALLHKCINEKTLNTKFKLHLTLIHQSGSISPTSISIHNEKSDSIKTLEHDSFFNKNYTVTIADNIKLINLDEGKFRYTFYIWFVKRDWIICRLDIVFDSHPCQHKYDFPNAAFIPFCYYNVNANTPMSIEELNEEYNRHMNKNKTMEFTSLLQLTNKNLTMNKNKSKASIKKKKLKKQNNNSNIQTNLKTIIIIIIICVLILSGLSLIIFYFIKRKKQDEENDLVKELKKSSIDSIISTTNDETSENSLSSKEKTKPVNVQQYVLDDDIQ
ncbi:unnamed protein product [Rotaria sordida]|uniref:Uncharacterized protein n=1 Tax=Rotaria sordida TaxID=392033 RepID=A0A815GNG7_9BILA|nr:unnamed protein product [Rotaria sordida]CAF3897774.1 unnamed protein product [Rotaria sordida]